MLGVDTHKHRGPLTGLWNISGISAWGNLDVRQKLYMLQWGVLVEASDFSEVGEENHMFPKDARTE